MLIRCHLDIIWMIVHIYIFTSEPGVEDLCTLMTIASRNYYYYYYYYYFESIILKGGSSDLDIQRQITEDKKSYWLT